VHNDAFCIGSDGVFGTINGLRLGRVAAVPVEWSEINAAWGMTLLLLISLAKKVGLTFETYVLGLYLWLKRVNLENLATVWSLWARSRELNELVVTSLVMSCKWIAC